MGKQLNANFTYTYFTYKLPQSNRKTDIIKSNIDGIEETACRGIDLQVWMKNIKLSYTWLEKYKIKHLSFWQLEREISW